jgi:hypothetical protein
MDDRERRGEEKMGPLGTQSDEKNFHTQTHAYYRGAIASFNSEKNS